MKRSEQAQLVYVTNINHNIPTREGEPTGTRRPDRRICVVQRISDGTKECEKDGSQRKSEAVEKECRTSGGQTDMTDLRCSQI